MAKFTLTTKTGKKFQLNDSDEIHRGGEGRILAIASAPTLVAKIYHDNIATISEEQFDYLSKLNDALFVVPKDLLFEKSQKIVGFTMEYLGQDYFPLSSVFSKSFCLMNDINDNVKRKISDNLINAVEYAHKNNLVIGDLNQYNVMINKLGEIRLIDVDSYQTPNHLHSGLLLEDIRDYLHGGFINKNSDFFALSVLLFYSLTYAHPFKGIHKKIKILADRMKLKLPIFINDPDLIPPKCYEPITDDMLQNQFSKFYLGGDRFLISMSGVGAMVSRKPKPTIIDKIIQKDLVITPIVQNTNVVNVVFSSESGYIETDDLFVVYNAKNKGYLNEKCRILKKDFSHIYLSSENILVRKSEKLFHYKSATEIVELTNYSFPMEALVYQLNDILVVVGNDVMNWLYLNEVRNNSIQNKRIEVFSKGFRLYNGLIQNAGGINRIFYHTGKDIATVKFDQKSVKEIYQQGNVGMVQYVDNNVVKNKYFKIVGLNVEFANFDSSKVFDFAFMPTQSPEGFVFQPSDNKILILRTLDFQQTSEMDCDLVSEQTKLQHSKAGIIAWEGKAVYLLNKK